MERRIFTERLYAALEAQLAKDKNATLVLTLMGDGIDVARDQADATKLPIEAIRSARRRLFDAAEKVAREALGEEAPRGDA